MDVVWLQFFQQTAVVRDRENAQRLVGAGTFVAHCLDAASASAECIDIEPGVEFIENRYLRGKNCELQCLVALLLSAGKVDIE